MHESFVNSSWPLSMQNCTWVPLLLEPAGSWLSPAPATATDDCSTCVLGWSGMLRGFSEASICQKDAMVHAELREVSLLSHTWSVWVLSQPSRDPWILQIVNADDPFGILHGGPFCCVQLHPGVPWDSFMSSWMQDGQYESGTSWSRKRCLQWLSTRPGHTSFCEVNAILRNLFWSVLYVPPVCPAHPGISHRHIWGRRAHSHDSEGRLHYWIFSNLPQWSACVWVHHVAQVCILDIVITSWVNGDDTKIRCLMDHAGETF